jgi:tetratricopeptide (TPR) repeat protein
VFCKQPKVLFGILILILLIAAQACARRSGVEQLAGVERLAVLPIENLSSDAGLDWRSRAAAAVVVYDLAGAKNIFAQQVDSLSAAQSMQASRLLQGYFFERNGRIGIRATLEDLGQTKTNESFDIDGPASAGFLPLANELARRLSPQARSFGTRNEIAFRLYGEALAALDPQSLERALEAATAADPAFAAGYVDQARVLAESGNRERARQIVQEQERAKPDPIDRANLQLVAAAASGDPAARMKALDSLSVATPANANIFTELGAMRYARREFEQAAAEYRTAARLDPEEPQIWNQLGYALAWAHDLSGAREALAQYQKLSPDDGNALDSQGEVSYMLGDFKSAAEYFERAAARNPAEFVKAAEARLMLGDRSGADALFAKHFGPGARAENRGADYQTAQWEFLTGRRPAAMDRVEKLAPALNGDLQALAYSQLAIWELELGDRKKAADWAEQAAARAQSPQAHGIAEICRYIAAGATAVPLANQPKLDATSSGSKMADAYALLFAGKFREAVPWLQAIYGETNPSADGQVRTLLAWAYVETSAIDKAAGLVSIYPLPLSSGDPLFASVIFPRFLTLRATVLQKQGNADEAKKIQAYIWNIPAAPTKAAIPNKPGR